MTPWILYDIIIIALLEHMDAPTSLALICAAKFLQPYMQRVDHIKKLYVENNSACIITYSGKLLFLINSYRVNGTESQFRYFAEFVKQQKLIIRKVSCGVQHIAAITSTGKLILWGDNRYDQCSLPDEYTGDNESTFREVSCSNYSTVAITTSGKIVLFGNNKFKEGDSPPEEETFCKIKYGINRIAALTTTGKLFVWIRSHDGFSIVVIDKTILYQKIHFSSDSVVALTMSGKITLFRIRYNKSLDIQHADEDVFRSVSIGQHVIAITSAGKIVSWGKCTHFNCKTHHLTTLHHNFRKIRCSHNITMALTSEGELLMGCSMIDFEGQESITAHAKTLIREYK